MAKKKTTKKRKRSKKYKPDKRFFNINKIDCKSMVDTLKRLREYGPEVTFVAPRPESSVWNTYNKIKVELIKANALIIVDDSPNSNVVMVKVNEDFNF